MAGWLGNTLKVKVRAAPEKGKANAAVVSVLAKTLGVDDAAVTILSGKTSQLKVAEIDGWDLDSLKIVIP